MGHALSQTYPTEDYDLEPICYCPRCYSLRIGRIGNIDGADYCMDCGCSETAEASIGEWERLYKERYGHKLVERVRSPQEARIEGMSSSELREELCGRDDWRVIAESLYPGFPRGLPKVDSILVLFDKVTRDGREKEVKKLLAETL